MLPKRVALIARCTQHRDNNLADWLVTDYYEDSREWIGWDRHGTKSSTICAPLRLQGVVSGMSDSDYTEISILYRVKLRRLTGQSFNATRGRPTHSSASVVSYEPGWPETSSRLSLHLFRDRQHLGDAVPIPRGAGNLQQFLDR